MLIATQKHHNILLAQMTLEAVVAFSLQLHDLLLKIATRKSLESLESKTQFSNLLHNEMPQTAIITELQTLLVKKHQVSKTSWKLADDGCTTPSICQNVYGTGRGWGIIVVLKSALGTHAVLELGNRWWARQCASPREVCKDGTYGATAAFNILYMISIAAGMSCGDMVKIGRMLVFSCTGVLHGMKSIVRRQAYSHQGSINTQSSLRGASSRNLTWFRRSRVLLCVDDCELALHIASERFGSILPQPLLQMYERGQSDCVRYKIWEPDAICTCWESPVRRSDC